MEPPLEEECTVFLKLMVVGDPKVGKSKFAEEILQLRDPPMQEIRTEDLRVKRSFFKNVAVQTRWEICHPLRIPNYRGIRGIIIFFDTTNRSSFNNVKKWCAEITRSSAEDVVVVIAGTKFDVYKSRVCCADEVFHAIHGYAPRNTYIFGEISSQVKFGLQSLYDYLLAMIFSHHLTMDTYQFETKTKRTFFSKLFSPAKKSDPVKKEPLTTEQLQIKRIYWLEIAQSIREQHRQKTSQFLHHLEEPILLILCCRAFVRSSLFYKDNLPLDVFKIIIYLSEIPKLIKRFYLEE